MPWSSVDFHGSTGYGQAFSDAIRNNWGGWPLEDLQKGLAAATSKFAWLDADNACALGASYGGYMMNWIEGKWPDRFKCIVQHDGVFDARAMAYETEELWFDEWEHGGKAYYEDPAAFEKWNPVNYVDKWKTPQLVITSEKDFRIPYTQGHRRVHRAPAARDPVAAARLPRREPLGAQAEERRSMVSRSAGLAGEIYGQGDNRHRSESRGLSGGVDGPSFRRGDGWLRAAHA